MNRIIRALVVAVGLCALPGLAQAADIFMLIPGVAGDSTAKGHEGWIRVTSLDWETTASTTVIAGGGISAGKPSPVDLEFALASGPWSPQILRQITTGKSYPKVTFDAVAADGRPLYRLTLDALFFTQFRQASLPTTALPQDLLKSVFRTMRLDSYSMAADGRLITTSIVWDFATGVVQ